jgi:hypothetical protein
MGGTENTFKGQSLCALPVLGPESQEKAFCSKQEKINLFFFFRSYCFWNILKPTDLTTCEAGIWRTMVPGQPGKK